MQDCLYDFACCCCLPYPIERLLRRLPDNTTSRRWQSGSDGSPSNSVPNTAAIYHPSTIASIRPFSRSYQSSGLNHGTNKPRNE